MHAAYSWPRDSLYTMSLVVYVASYVFRFKVLNLRSLISYLFNIVRFSLEIFVFVIVCTKTLHCHE